MRLTRPTWSEQARHPFVGRQVRPVWVVLGIALTLVVCCCGGFTLAIGRGALSAGSSTSAKTPEPSTTGTSTPSSTRTTATAGGVIPDVVCRDLESAQDALRDAGFRDLASVDGTGKGRHQIIDHNWVVTAQSAAPGTRPDPSTRVTLTVVKFGEPTTRCPT